MDVESLAIPDVVLLTPRLFNDPRGWFQESYSLRTMAAAGVPDVFVQDNHSLSQAVGTVRALHYQMPPHPQGKLVRVIRGAVFDVAVDIRKGSPTYGRHVSAIISAGNHCQVWVPSGFAHGFCTLEADTEVVYKTTDYYAPECDRGIAWDDPDLAIVWPVATGQAVLSEKDGALPSFRDFSSPFAFG